MKLRMCGLVVVVMVVAFLVPSSIRRGQATYKLWGGVAQAQAQTYDCSSQSEISVSQCQALVALYNSTNGAAWTDNTNWLATPSPCAWFGVICDDGNVAAISLADNALSGTLPSALSNLTALKSLSLYSNQLSGDIPPTLGTLTGLTDLNLSGNALSGNIPSQLGSLTNLTDLWLNNNQLTGAIPAQLGSIANLQNLILYDNQLSGAIPPELGNLGSLRTLFLSTNQLTDDIPTELGGLSQLVEIYITNNGLTGVIPPALGNLDNLKALRLSDNQLSGPIPASFGNLDKLEELWLNNNALTGSIPTQLGALANLKHLILYSNQLSGPIPPQLGALDQLLGLYLSDNSLNGAIPAQLGDLDSLQTLYLSDNLLGGTIPGVLGNLAQLSTLFLNDNALIGQVPAALGNAAQLSSLDLSNNFLSGALPASLSALSNMTSFGFSGTSLCVPEGDSSLTDWLAAIPTLSSSGLLCSQIPTPVLVGIPNAVRADAQIRVIGQRFQPQGPYDFALSGLGAPLGATTANDAGAFNEILTIPADFTALSAAVTLTASAAFEPMGAVQSIDLAWLPPLALSLNAQSAQPGESVTATLANLYTGTVSITVDGVTVAGPAPVASGALVLPFIVPSGGDSTPVSVAAVNWVNDLPFGQATAPFTLLPADSFDFEDQPNASVEVVAEAPPPPWQLDQLLTVSGSFPDIPAELREDVDLSVMFSDVNGRVFPLTSRPLSLNSNGTFNAQVKWSSLLSGDPVPSQAAGNLVITAQLDNVTKSIVKALPTQTSEAPFGLRIVVTGTGQYDGREIPVTENASAPLMLFRPQGIAYADAAALDAATFTDTLRTAFRSVYADQIQEAIGSVVGTYFDCHPFVENDTYQPLTPIWYPPDRYKIISDLQNLPMVQIPTLVKEINAGPAAAGIQPAAVVAPDDLIEVRFIYVSIDATQVKDGTIAPNGYGPPDLIQLGRKFAYGGLYAVVPATGDIYLVRGFDTTNVIKSVSFERLPAGPVVIALQPYPTGARPRREFEVTVPGLNVVNIRYVPADGFGAATLPIRTYGQLYSFKNFPPQVAFTDDALQIYVVVNDGYRDADQVELADIQMTLTPADGGKVTNLPISQEFFGGDPCKNSQRVRYVGTLLKAGSTLGAGIHRVDVSVADSGQQRLSRQIELSYLLPPAYFTSSGLKNQSVIWGVTTTKFTATRYDASDDTKVPGDLQINPPTGPRPNALHIDNASGLDNRITQMLTPSDFGAVRQTSNSRATAWNNSLSRDINSARQIFDVAAATLSTPWQAAANRPPIPCDPNNLYEQCIGPKSFSTPKKEMMLFPPIVWGLPPLADIRIAGTLAYLAGVDASGVVRVAVPPELTMQVWPYAEVTVAIDVAAQVLGGLAARLGVNTSANIHADVPVVFSSTGKSDTNACFRWFIEVRFYFKSVCIPYTDECAVDEEIDKRTILDGREPNSPFCNAQAGVVAATVKDIPPSGNPTIATDGIHMLALWNTAENELVYSHFDGNQWSVAQPVNAGRIAERAAVIYFDTDRAIAVWNGTTLSQLGGQTIDQAVAAQVLEYSLWNGTTWSAPARLAPASAGDGGAVLASCPAGAAGCPISGEVTVAWTHLADGILSNLKLRVYTARFANGTWSAPQAVDPASNSLDTAPMIAYTAGDPVVGWVRDADSSFATTADRRIVLRNLSTATVEAPQSLPGDVVAGSLAADSQGQLILTYTRATDGALLSNHHEIVAARQRCQGGCTWTAITLVDTNGRVLQGEQPVLTIDSQDRATITYRATGFGPDAQGNSVYPTDARGILVGSGELAQVELNNHLTPATPRALTNDGVLNWEPTAVYNAGLNQIVALSVHRPAVGAAASSSRAGTQALDETLALVSTDRQPDFRIESVEAIYPSPTATLPSSIVVTITNQGAAATGPALPLEVAAAWDASPLAAQQVITTSVAALQGGAATNVTLQLPVVRGSADVVHRLYITVNGNRAIAESELANNEVILTVGGVSAPEQVYVAADPMNGLLHVQWDAPLRSGSIAGYRIYRRTATTPWQPVGSSFGVYWADVNADFDTTYEYGVRAYTAAGVESDLSQTMKAKMIPLPPATTPSTLFLPSVSNMNSLSPTETPSTLFLPNVSWLDGQR
ncbi:MAG: hypothetical protein KF893_20395 [Caldilineaceae bacterium]|nr:hypothetical protein [Caldilineaceae bacterium]